MSEVEHARRVSPSSIRLARALVADAAKRGEKESPQIEAIAAMKTPEERRRVS